MISEAKKTRLGVALSQLFREPSWQAVRQFCVAESAEEDPDYDGLTAFIVTQIQDSVETEIVNGIEARRQ